MRTGRRNEEREKPERVIEERLQPQEAQESRKLEMHPLLPQREGREGIRGPTEVGRHRRKMDRGSLGHARKIGQTSASFTDAQMWSVLWLHGKPTRVSFGHSLPAVWGPPELSLWGFVPSKEILLHGSSWRLGALDVCEIGLKPCIESINHLWSSTHSTL